MAAHFVHDLDVLDPTVVDNTTPLYPVAQWLHGDPKMAASGGVAFTGGVIMPARHLDEDSAPAAGWEKTRVAFSSGKSELVLACQKPQLAVIRTRFRWFASNNGMTTYYPRAGYLPEAGMRGHVQALCAVSGYEQPFVVTFKGKASQEFERLLRDFSQRVQEAAQRVVRERAAAGQTSQASRFPRFAFYMRLAPGPHLKVGQNGQGAIITPPGLEIPGTLTENVLAGIYVGRERLITLQQVFHDSAAWGTAWNRPESEETHEQEDSFSYEDAPIPF